MATNLMRKIEVIRKTNGTDIRQVEQQYGCQAPSLGAARDFGARGLQDGANMARGDHPAPVARSNDCLEIAKKFQGTFCALSDGDIIDMKLKPGRIRELFSMASDYEAARAGKPRETKLPNEREFGEMEWAVLVVKRKKAVMKREGASLELTDDRIKQIFERFVLLFEKLEGMDATGLEYVCRMHGIKEKWEANRSESPKAVLKWGSSSPFWYLKQVRHAAEKVLGGNGGNTFSKAELMKIRNIIDWLEKNGNKAHAQPAQEESRQVEAAQSKGSAQAESGQDWAAQSKGNLQERLLCKRFNEIPGGWLGARSGLRRSDLERIETDAQKVVVGELQELPEASAREIKRLVLKYNEYLEGRTGDESAKLPRKYDENFDFADVVRVGFGTAREQGKK